MNEYVSYFCFVVIDSKTKKRAELMKKKLNLN